MSKYWLGHIVDAHREMMVDSVLAVYGFWMEVLNMGLKNAKID